MSDPIASLPQIEIDGDSISLNQEAESAIASLDQWFGAWAIHEPRFNSMLQSLRDFDLASHINQQAPRQVDTGYELSRGRIAVVRLQGTMTKRGSSISGGGTVETRRQIRNALNDSSVEAIMLAIESPGGTVSGTKELADEVAIAAQSMPVYAYIEDLGASAAYYVASQSSKIFANEPALVGSIGTFMVLVDSSKAAENAGIEVHVIRAGEFKGVATPGTAITEEHLSEFKSLIDQSNDLFLKAVASGRGMSRTQVNQLADGRVHMAGAAADLNLIDSVGTFGAALDALEAELTTSVRSEQMPQEPIATTDDKPKAATTAELRAACPGASADFLLEQFENQSTVSEAQAAFIAQQQQDLEAERKAAAEAQQRASEAEERATANLPGNDPHQTEKGIEESTTWHKGDAKATWDAKIAEKVSLGVDRLTASVQVNAENPGLREAMLAEFKPQNKVKA